jgi:tetratricopeptide (TPR) repeat protein
LLLATPGELDEAVRVLEEARSLDPNSVDGVVLLSRAYTALGRGDDAMGLLQATAAEHHGRRVKEMSGVYLEISRMQLEEGFLSDAMQSLSKAFDMDLRNAQLGMHLGELALEIEEWEAAGRAFRQVAMMKPYNEKKGEGANSDQKANANYYLAWLALQTGDTRKAKLLASKALAANSNHEQARALLDQIENG